MSALGILRQTGYRWLLIGQAVSSFGDWMGTIALMALALDLTGSAAAVGVVLVLRMLPAALAGPVAAGVAERWDRRRIMLTMDLVRVAFAALIPVVHAVWWVYLWAFLLEAASVVFLPARDASIPDLVSDEDTLPTANALVFVSSYGNIPIGAAAFAGITALPYGQGWLGGHPRALAFWIDAATFLVSFAFIRRLTVLGPAQRGGRPQPSGERGGLRDALRLPVVRAVLPATATAVLGIGALFSLGIVFVNKVLGASTGQFGVLVALFGVGGVGGWALVQRRSHGTPSLGLIRASVAAMGVVLALMSLTSSIGLAYLAAVPFGAAAAAALIAGVTYLQETLDEEQRVLGLTAFHVVLRVGMSLAAIGAGFAAQEIAPVPLPLRGTVQPAALVLFCAGLVMVGGAALMPARLAEPEAEAEAEAEGA